MSRNGGRARELSVAVHSAHGIRHAIGSGAGSHVIRMQRSARAAAGSDGEVFLAVFDSPFFIGACNGMLEACGVGGVSCDGNIDALLAFMMATPSENVVRAIALDSRRARPLE